ncbi:hypothetical protein IT072_15430 [Leifsonia sp. ZF2019]|uniref:hypothetical protein n=1 Tax=Leifsonia sp. ZF2019 TaxID=2781978 RepID=UPI001CBC1A33|nr:hypothetical protein [Leifsonia sp. ZF2019]UAJ78620.1 hypothetical protein IT072_15430 [Leifsonia sp. ZF2019]
MMGRHEAQRLIHEEEERAARITEARQVLAAPPSARDSLDPQFATDEELAAARAFHGITSE